MTDNYRVAVIELDDICPRIEPDLPNLFVGVTSRTPDELFRGLSNNKFRPKWARGHVITPRNDLIPDRCTSLDDARHRKAEHIKGLRRQGFTVNRNTKATEHLRLDALKIGVASDDSPRLSNHENRGWQLVDSWWFPHLTDAYVIEELILDRWRNLYHTLPHVAREEMPQKGFTETMARTSDAIHEIRRIVREQCAERLVPVSSEAWLMQGLQPVVSSQRFSSWLTEEGDDEAA